MTALTALPPGPAESPLTQLLRYSFTPLSWLDACAELGETFSFRLAGFGEFVMLTRPEDIREVFRGDATILHAGEGNALLSTLVGDTSVLVLDDAPHARQRRVLLPPLKGERMRTFFDAMQFETSEAAARWAAAGEVRADRDMQQITLRVILRAVHGMADPSKFAKLERAMTRVLNRSRNPLALVLYNLFPPHRFRDSRWLKYYRLLGELDEQLYDIIAAARAVPASERPACLMTDLLATTHEDGKPLSDVEIRDAVVTILAAGHDTTALSLAWAFEQIVPRPDVMARLYEELETVCGRDKPAPEHMNALVYLDACIRESLRIRTIVPFVVRVLKAPVSIGGVAYPQGITLCPAIHLLHQREDLYPQPREFRPERFLERKFAPHEWNPFGGGNRACLGQAFALYEMKVVLATMLSELALERPRGAVSKPVRRGITIGPSDGCRLIARRR